MWPEGSWYESQNDFDHMRRKLMARREISAYLEAENKELRKRLEASAEAAAKTEGHAQLRQDERTETLRERVKTAAQTKELDAEDERFKGRVANAARQWKA